MNIELVKNELKKEFNYLVLDKNIKLNRVDEDTHISFNKKKDLFIINYKKENEALRAIYECFKEDFSNDFSFNINFIIDFSLMIDLARNAVYKVESIKRLIRYISIMGYSELCLYLEDCFEVDDEPYFGYLRGRYSKNQLKEIIEYADIFNIKVTPYLETLAHLNAIKYWPVYRDHFDIADIVLINDDRVYTLIENMIKTIKKIFKGNEVHIGMDEAYLTGRGKYLDKYGYKKRIDLIKTHLDKVVNITKKYDLKPLMWSDMFFNSQNYAYEGINENIDNIDKDLTLVYWNYEVLNKNVFDKHIKTHKKISENIIVAGGSWTWLGFAPNNLCGINNSKRLMDVAIKNNIKKYVLTAWGDNGGETSIFSVLPTINFVSNFALYENKVKDDYLFSYLEENSFKNFMSLDLLNQSNKKFSVQNKTTINKIYLFNDLLLGKFDSTISPNQKKIFRLVSNKLKKCNFDSKFGYIFKSTYLLSKVLETKVNLGLDLRKAYKENNKEELKNIIKELKKLKKLLISFSDTYFIFWHKEKKGNGYDVIDLRIGGLKERIDTTIKLINLYLTNNIDKIDELEETILDFWGNLNKFIYKEDLYEGSYEAIKTVNVNW